MKNPNSINLKTVFWLLLCLVVLIGCKKEQKQTDVLAATAVNDSCSCDPSWFPHAQTPAPAEGKNSPFDASSTTNCIFHQWSWQKFLWLTKPQQNNNPLFLNELTQVSSSMIPVVKQTGASIVLTDTAQAGFQGVLRANPAYSGGKKPGLNYTVYYSIHSNDIMLKAAKNLKDSLAAKTLPVNNLRTFPVGSLELKVSWIDINTIAAADQKNYFTTTAAVSRDNGKTFTQKTVALLGMHVVGVVINHPEFIWATFQHHDLAPSYDWKNNNASSTNDKLLFSKGTTSGLDGITWGTTTPVLPLQPYDLFHYGVPTVPGGGFMGNTSQDGAVNYNNIESINQCVASNLDDVWKNYFYNGSIWMNTDGLSPTQQAQLLVNLGNGMSSGIKGASARGSLNNANITMETYTQTFTATMDSIKNTNLVNCFTCHNSVSFASGNPKSPIYTSHIFNGYLLTQQGQSKKQIDQLKLQETQSLAKKMRAKK